MLTVILLAICTLLSAFVTAGGSIAVALIVRQQKEHSAEIKDVREQLRTSNGKTVGDYVEKLANGADEKGT